MAIVTIKETAAFPEIGQVRKGAAKTEQGYVCKDLKDKFRVIFFAGDENQASRARFLEAHPNAVEAGPDILIDRLTVFLPFPDPMACFDSWYEAYTAGRLVARADGEKFIRWVDTKSGEVKVNNGEPFTPFERGMAVGSYVNRKTGKTETIHAKATGRLRVVLPELARLAYLTVYTTSIYDVVRLTEQLRAIHWISQFLPHRTGVAGIPLELSRRLVDVTWVQADGSAKRVKHGLLNIEIERGWVERMFTSLAGMALPAGMEAALLPAEGEVSLNIDPVDQAQAQEPEGGQEPEEGEVIDLRTNEPVSAETGGAPATTGNNEQPTINNGSPRPYAPEVLRLKLQDRADEFQRQRATKEQIDLCKSLILQAFDGEGAEEKYELAMDHLFGQPTIKALKSSVILAMLKVWLKPWQDTDGAFQVDEMAARELLLAYDAALRSQGETVMEL